jgi:hypothetical protein
LTDPELIVCTARLADGAGLSWTALLMVIR